MLRARIISLLILAFAVGLAGCGKGADEARLQLAQMNVPFTDRAFIENARDGNASAIELFIKAGMDTEVRNAEGQTPLHAATLASKFDVVKLLVEKGADVNATNKFQGTPLMSAAWAKDEAVFNFLLASGPKPTRRIIPG